MSVNTWDNQHINAATGREIQGIEVEDDIVRIEVDGGILELTMSFQCCETRYFHTSDCLPDFEGAEFKGLNVSAVESDLGYADNGLDDFFKEMTFLDILTSLGVITIEAYNIHNGYYAGFNFFFRFVRTK